MLTKSQNHNPNYLAKVVKLDNPTSHPNAERLLGWNIDGNKVWTDNKNYNNGDIVIYFPLECQINPLILSQLNLYSNSDMNIDKTQKGFFDKNGRVRAIKLRGEPSEGFILKIGSLFEGLGYKDVSEWQPLLESEESILNYEFDIIDLVNVSDTWICRKYIPQSQGKTVVQRQGKKVRDVLVDGQFRFHYDTEQLKKNIDEIKPSSDLITITKKYHGTSGVSANVLVKKKWHKTIKFFNNAFTVENCFFSFWLMLSIISYRLLPIYLNFYWLMFPHILLMLFNKKYRDFMRQPIGYLPETEYKDICSSRRVIKSIGEEQKSNGGYYDFDIWKHCHNILKSSLEQGITLYYEIVGYLPNGQLIQKGYDYGCKKPNELDFVDGQPKYYEENKEFKILVYRITYTTPESKTIEFSWQQIKRYCERYGLNMPKTYYEGKAVDCFTGHEIPSLRVTDAVNNKSEEIAEDSFHQRLLNGLEDLYLEIEDDECANNVPDEGIVVRIEDGRPRAYKLKSFAFLEKESKALDNDELDIETEQSE